MTLLLQQQSLLSNLSGLQITSTVVTVTPELAKTWLKGMIQNQRPPSDSSVLKYSRAMTQGKWKIASPLSFDVEGQLIDGQHRLLAVVKANRSIDFIVQRGLPTDAIEAIDIGVLRTSAHLAKLQGSNVTGSHIALLNCCFFCPTSNLTKPPSFSKQEQVELAIAHFEALDFALKKRNEGVVAYAPYLACVARAYYSENRKRLEQFLQVLHSGYTVSENSNDDSAAIALRNLHFKNRGQKIRQAGGRDTRVQAFKIGSNALANFLLRKPIKILKESSANQFPVADFDQWWKDKQQPTV
jgi:hypothetical protein